LYYRYAYVEQLGASAVRSPLSTACQMRSKLWHCAVKEMYERALTALEGMMGNV
jgi:hypothetical protein